MKISVINGCNIDNYDMNIADKLYSYFNQIGKLKDLVNLGEIKLGHCISCDYCQNSNPGICCLKDEGNKILKQYLESELVVIISPVQFGCFNSITKNFIDRCQPLFLPYHVSRNHKTVMKQRYDTYPDILFIGISENNNSESTNVFKDIILNCTLSSISRSASVEIISDETKLFNKLKELEIV